MVILEWVVIAGVCVLVSSVLVRSLNSTQQKQRLERAFYYLLETEDSCVSLIRLAIEAKVDAEVTKQFLDTQVKYFGAELEVDADGDTFYRFPKLRRSPQLEPKRDEW
ncbi:hypothetical protein J5X98_26945 [Leptothermofonsia sichuanensis E412]|jgi:hypothetical protein|uniref:hypothetical protein n=1 Tax=Leptothermofonsia sichuanensis TaxID=2917832 RepID=UPI001CA75887|nr:hypothetical protein [Leptothermofonsia sichuanensis]QZZ20802.1 hypothetical protein J5X98_26945 [Leptothermofonsia sichuanensis E412]